MKEREKEILKYMIEHNKVSLDILLTHFNISKRTLYYDIKSINYFIKKSGSIKNINGSFCFVGEVHSLQELMQEDDNHFLSNENRVNYVLLCILKEKIFTIDSLAFDMAIAKNTVVKVIEDTKKLLFELNMSLEKSDIYRIQGSEVQIRNLYLSLLQEDQAILASISERVIHFDKASKLCLTDYALATLSKFIVFIEHRFNNNHIIQHSIEEQDIAHYSYYDKLSILTSINDKAEKIYIAAFISSLSSFDLDVEIPLINYYVRLLVSRFEAVSAINIVNREDFTQHLKRHLQASYYRIKFHFPVSNPLLPKIKKNHEMLFKIMKRILENNVDFPCFNGIREEEVAFITTYFGAYLRGSNVNKTKINKAVIVCPQGLMVSKSLEIQLSRYIPTIEIVGSSSIYSLNSFPHSYNYIISTIKLDGYESVLVVNPILTRLDIDYLMNAIYKTKNKNTNIKVDEIIQAVSENAVIHDIEKLKKSIESIVYEQYVLLEEGEYQPMLKDLISLENISVIKKVDDWQDAIRIASKPLLSNGAIEEEYVRAMIESIEKHGPYIVLADRFALPHASAASGVNKVAMALLVVEEEVDLLSKPVNLFMVLATTDNTSHMKALANLTEILYEQENMQVFLSGNKNEIMKIINCSTNN